MDKDTKVNSDRIEMKENPFHYLSSVDAKIRVLS